MLKGTVVLVYSIQIVSLFFCFLEISPIEHTFLFIFIWDNYSKPTCGMTRFHFAYLWFNHLHFTHLNFNLLPIRYSPLLKSGNKNVFYLHFYVSLL